MIVPLAIIAALDECMTAVDLDKVELLRYAWKPVGVPPVLLRPKNQHGYYFLEDGHHRVVAALLDRRSRIDAELIVTGGPVELSWRWPRIAPVSMVGQLIAECGAAR